MPTSRDLQSLSGKEMTASLLQLEEIKLSRQLQMAVCQSLALKQIKIRFRVNCRRGKQELSCESGGKQWRQSHFMPLEGFPSHGQQYTPTS